MHHLPEEIIHWVLSQKCLDEKDIRPFLLCKSTCSAAYRCLLSGKSVHIRCQSHAIQSKNHYDFGVYGGLAFPQSSSRAASYHISSCVDRSSCAEAKNTTLRASSDITVNVSFDDESARVTCRYLRRLANLLSHCGRPLHIHATFAYSRDILTAPVLAALDALLQSTSAPVYAKIFLPQWLLPAVAPLFSAPHLHSLNIQCLATSCKPFEEPVAFDLSHITRLKLIANFPIPNLSLAASLPPPLQTLELHLPILAHSRWIAENHLATFHCLSDLRLFSLSDTSSLRFVFPSSLHLRSLRTLFVSFTLPLQDETEFDFLALSPSLHYLYLSDCRWEKSLKNFRKSF